MLHIQPKHKRRCCLISVVRGKVKLCNNKVTHTLYVDPKLHEKEQLYHSQKYHLYSCESHVSELLRTKEFVRAEALLPHE